LNSAFTSRIDQEERTRDCVSNATAGDGQPRSSRAARNDSNQISYSHVCGLVGLYARTTPLCCRNAGDATESCFALLAYLAASRFAVVKGLVLARKGNSTLVLREF
jgi:hypothetical protein